MSSIEEAYEEYLPEGADGLTKEQATDALFATGQNPTAIDVANFYKDKGKSNSDLLNLEELIELNEHLGDPEEAMRNAFHVFDKDGNDKISRDELISFLKAADVYGSGIGDDTDIIDQIFATADGDESKELDVDEFVNIIQSGIWSHNLSAS